MKLNSIQLLRALAAILVVYTHSISQMGIFAVGWQQRTPMRISLGTFGVDIFFVISGFIIYQSAHQLNGAKPSLTFLWHRFRRINPPYYAVVLLTVITWLPSLIQHQRPSITGYQTLSWAILLPFPGDPSRALSQGWSLLFEWFFYLVFFLLILARTKRKAATLWAVLGGLTMFGWVFRNSLTGLLTFYTDPLLLEFLFGVIIGVVFQRWDPGKRTAIFLVTAGAVSGVFFMLSGYFDYQAVLGPSAAMRYLHALCWGSAAALVVAGCVFLEKVSSPTFLRHRFLLFLGDASYSIYLFHLIIFGLIAAFYLRVGFFLNPDVAIPLHAAIAVAGSLLFYHWIERPLLNWFRNFGPGRLNPSRSLRP